MFEVVSVQLYDFSQKVNTFRGYITRLETVKTKLFLRNLGEHCIWQDPALVFFFFSRKYLTKIKEASLLFITE